MASVAGKCLLPTAVFVTDQEEIVSMITMTNALRWISFVCGMGLLLASSALAQEQATPESTGPARKFTAIEVYPPELTLSSIRDSRRVLVTGVMSDGQRIDLSSKATVSTQSPVCQVDAAGFVAPVAAGEGVIIVEAEGLKTEVKVHVTSADPINVDFIREVNPILSKVGCNQGTCHGSQAGKNGFKLSLRGYDSVYDYRVLVDDLSGRRFNHWSRRCYSQPRRLSFDKIQHGRGVSVANQRRFRDGDLQGVIRGCA